MSRQEMMAIWTRVLDVARSGTVCITYGDPQNVNIPWTRGGVKDGYVE